MNTVVLGYNRGTTHLIRITSTPSTLLRILLSYFVLFCLATSSQAVWVRLPSCIHVEFRGALSIFSWQLSSLRFHGAQPHQGKKKHNLLSRRRGTYFPTVDGFRELFLFRGEEEFSWRLDLGMGFLEFGTGIQGFDFYRCWGRVHFMTGCVLDPFLLG